MNKTISPLGHYLVVEAAQEPASVAGIILTAETKKPTEGIVVAAGPGKMVGQAMQPLEITIGDRILFSKFSPNEIEVDGRKLIILSIDDVYAKLINDE